MRPVAALALIGLLIAGPASAQHTIGHVGRVELTARDPYCDPFALRYDKVWFGGQGFTLPRVGWHVLYPALNVAIHNALVRTALPKVLVAAFVAVGLPLLPHAIQTMRGLRGGSTVTLNVPDVIADFHNRTYVLSDRSARWVATDLLLSCWAVP